MFYRALNGALRCWLSVLPFESQVHMCQSSKCHTNPLRTSKMPYTTKVIERQRCSPSPRPLKHLWVILSWSPWTLSRSLRHTALPSSIRTSRRHVSMLKYSCWRHMHVIANFRNSQKLKKSKNLNFKIFEKLRILKNLNFKIFEFFSFFKH